MHPYIACDILPWAEAYAIHCAAKAVRAEEQVVRLRMKGIRSDAFSHGRNAASWTGEATQQRAMAERAAAVAESIRREAPPPTWLLSIDPDFDFSARAARFVVRAGTPLRLPAEIKSFQSLGISRVAYGDTAEVSCGDHVIFAERSSYGLEVFLRRIGPTGETESRDIKPGIRFQVEQAILTGTCGADFAILRGAGYLAAAVRRIHAERAGFVGTTLERKTRSEALRIFKARLPAPPPIPDDDVDVLAAMGL
ncbi:hypothetical protein [Rhodoblastus sp.]|uniref:hypothetical protein n=1 Tax=Rhodoblastus sp. TaxID=1962975 RepID=UPI003F9E8FAE